jgi:glycosyltransferase involved in cell wall biosynthesis
MKVSGFTILRQTERLGYPFRESLRSLLPLVDELVVGVGDGDDGTWEAVQEIGDVKIRAFRSPWDPARRRGGEEISRQTNLALRRCAGDWAIYLQADEVLHESDLDRIDAAMRRHLPRRTEGLLFTYLHFFGSYAVVAAGWPAWYPRAVRAIKLGADVRSSGDGCGFTLFQQGRPRGLIKADSGARVFHYGWCGERSWQLEKRRNLERFYTADDAGIEQRYRTAAEASGADLRRQPHLRRFTGMHPNVMTDRVRAQGWTFEPCVQPRWRSWTATLGGLLKYPFGRRGNSVRAIVPTAISNAAWLALDRWRRLT